MWETKTNETTLVISVAYAQDLVSKKVFIKFSLCVFPLFIYQGISLIFYFHIRKQFRNCQKLIAKNRLAGNQNPIMPLAFSLCCVRHQQRFSNRNNEMLFQNRRNNIIVNFSSSNK